MEDDYSDFIPWDSSEPSPTGQLDTGKATVAVPVVVKTDTGYTAYALVPKGGVFFRFSEFSHSRQSVDCVMTIDLQVNDGQHPTFSQRIDLRSGSAMRSLATDLNGAYGNKNVGYNWVLILNSVFNQVTKALYDDQSAQSIEGTEYEDIPFLLYPFLQQNVSNMLFAESEAGKTWFALRLAISLASGVPFFDYRAVAGTNTLFIDYEDDIKVFKNRVHALCAGSGIEFKTVAPHLKYFKPTGSLRMNIEVLKSLIAKDHFGLIIIDAGGDAAGGSPSDEEKVLDLFNALDELPVTKLILHHEPKTVMNQSAAFYGSMYWKARSRVAWRLQVESDEAGAKLIKASIQKRSNLPYIEPFYYRSQFVGGMSVSDLDSDDAMAAAKSLIVTLNKVTEQQLIREKPIEEGVVESLEKHGDLTVYQLKDLLGRERSVVFKKLKEMDAQGVIENIRSGTTFVWRLKK